MSNNNTNSVNMGAAAIIGAAASVLGAGASVASGMKSLKKQKKLLNYQNEINNANYDKMLKDSRDYKAIVEAARKAGINPLVALGQSAGAGSVQGSSIPAESSLPGVIASGAGSVASSISNLDLIGEQKELLKEQAEAQNIDNQIQLKELQDMDRQKAHQIAMDEYSEKNAELSNAALTLDNSLKALEESIKQKDLALQEELFDSTVEQAKVNLQLARDAHDLNEIQKEKGLIENFLYEERLQSEIANLKASTWAIYKAAELEDRKFQFTKEDSDRLFKLAKKRYKLDKNKDLREGVQSWLDRFQQWINNAHNRKMDKAEFNRQTDELISQVPDSVPGIAMFLIGNAWSGIVNQEDYYYSHHKNNYVE